MTRTRVRSEPTHYMNVDLDIMSRVSVDGLVEAMGEDVFVLYVGGSGRKYEAHVELASSHMGMPADRTIMGLVALVKRLPGRERRIWDAATSRDFNVGIEAGMEPHSYELRLDRRTIDAVAKVGGDVVVTVYAPVVSHPAMSGPPKGGAVRKRSLSAGPANRQAASQVVNGRRPREDR